MKYIVSHNERYEVVKLLYDLYAIGISETMEKYISFVVTDTDAIYKQYVRERLKFFIS